MELITISIGIAIIVLGVAYVFGGASIPPALVMGISIAGLCFTINDFIIKLEIGPNKFIKKRISSNELGSGNSFHCNVWDYLVS